MNIISQLFGGGISGIGDAFKQIMGTFKLDPETKAKMELAVEENKFQLAQMDADLTAKMQDIAGQNIRAEEQGGDKYTSRARPTFLYIIEAVLAFNYLVIPLVQLCAKQPIAPFALPGNLLWLFGSGFMGYCGVRSLDKVMGLPGESNITLPFGLGSVSNKQ